MSHPLATRAGGTVPLAALTIAAVAFAADLREERVRFATGASEATVTGRLAGDLTVDYKVRASAGQTLAVELRGSNPSNYFNVLPPGSADVAMFVGQDGGNFRGVLPDDGDYTVRVYLMRSAARRAETSDYTLRVAVTGEALRPLPVAQDAVLPGTRFHASAPLRCTPPYASEPGECEAFVVRRGVDGTATVEVRAQGRTVRRLLFVAGRPAASDATEATSSERAGDETLIRIGAEERYRIPDALLTGG